MQYQEKFTPPLLSAKIEKSLFTHIIFDLDGTLVDSAPGIIAGISAALLQNSISPLCELTEAIIGTPLDDTLRIVTGISDSAMLKKLADSFKDYYDNAGYKQTLLFEGVNNMLHYLHSNGYTLHIATNKRLKPTLLILNYFGWKIIFSSVYTLDSAEPRYPNKIMMLSDQLEAELIASNDGVYVGDSEEDRTAAIENKLHFIHADWGYSDG